MWTEQELASSATSIRYLPIPDAAICLSVPLLSFPARSSNKSKGCVSCLHSNMAFSSSRSSCLLLLLLLLHYRDYHRLGLVASTTTTMLRYRQHLGHRPITTPASS